MSDILVIKCNYNLNSKDFLQIRDNFITMKAEGTVMLPLGFDAVVVPDDIEIKFENNSKISNLPERYKTCGRCIHDVDNPNINTSKCYLCRRNSDDHRIDWFEERGDDE